MRNAAVVLRSLKTVIKQQPEELPEENVPNTTVVTKWKKRGDVCSDSDEQWLGECAEKTTSRGERERRAVWIPPSSRKVAEFRAR